MMRSRRQPDRPLSVRHRLVAASVGLLLSACSATPDEAIVGTWQQTGGTRSTLTMEFANDGTVTALKESRMEAAFGERTHATGRYVFLDDNRVEFDFEITALLAGSTIMQVAISRDELTLTATPNGVPSRYRRTH